MLYSSAMANANKSAKSQKPKALTGSWEFVPVSWKLLKQNINTVIILALLPAFIAELAITLGASSSVTKVEAAGLLLLIGMIWSLINRPALYYFEIGAARGKPPSLGKSYRYGLKRFWRWLGMEILVVILVIGGFILLIVPGVIMLRLYYLASFYLLDQDLSIKQAMRKSANESNPVSGYVYGVIGISIAFSIIASFFARIAPPIGTIIGVFITYIYLFGGALRYMEVKQ
jgi:uncharacterized membrane protein